ncbi:MAG: DUF3320 domain-containing protein [Deltaproteobacteria bacterium]|nr:DUF3320 domain-containing protein [Deltaproteobacteria bacterium]
MTDVRQELDRARELLLDLTLRNRLLNFRPTRRTTVPICDELPSAVFQSLVQQERSFAFLSAEERPERARAEEADARGQPPIETALGENELPKHHRDRFLQTPLDAKNLQTNLLRTQRAARDALEEKGVNLLHLAVGFLEWRRPDRPDHPLKAPLILVPAELSRSSARRRFQLQALPDDPLLNPCLAAMLGKDHGIRLPEEPEDWEAFDLAARCAAISELISDQDGWRVTDEMALGLFSFTKYLMYLDLDPERWSSAGLDLCAHPLLRTLCSGEPAGPLDGLPAPDSVEPADCFQVMNADASQQVAIAAAKHGKSFVIEGPPGTGKSQTIANMIAECLGADMRVLFVSQKLAALQVVKRRLDRVGLGDFCLELHSTKANRKATLAEIGRVLEEGRLEAEVDEETGERLSQLRRQLNGYASALHSPIEPLGLSPYEAIGRMLALADCPDIFCELPGSRDWSAGRLRELIELAASLGRRCEAVSPVEQHLWRHSGLGEIGPGTLQAAREGLEALNELTAAVRNAASGLAKQLEAPMPQGPEESRQTLQAAEHLAVSVGVPASLLESTCWDDYTVERKELVESLEKLDALRSWLIGRYDPEEAKSVDWQSIYKRGRRTWHSVFRFFRPSYWADRRQLKQARLRDHQPVPSQALEDLKQLATYRTLLADIKALDEEGRRAFGVYWRGSRTDPRSISRLADWLHTARRLLTSGRIGPRGIALCFEGADRKTIKQAVAQFQDLTGRWQAARERLVEILQLDSAGLPAQEAGFAEWSERLSELQAGQEKLHDWIAFQHALQECRSGPLSQFADKSRSKTLAFDLYGPALEKQALRLFVETALSEKPELSSFNARDHEAARAEFARLDREWTRQTSARLHAKLSANRPVTAFGVAASSKLGLLQGEIARKRGGRSIRRLLADAGEVVQRLKPCMMMSPLSVSQFLAPGKVDFDLVIFDEASQVEPADALGAIARAGQLVLVGDTRQLPPTGFFRSAGGEDDPDDEQDAQGAAGIEDMESILDRGGMVLARTRLRWHYRSRHDSLISYSNKEFYEKQLVVFPACQAREGVLGLQVAYEPADWYQPGRGTNPSQAERIGRWVFEQARAHPEKSIGVGTFSQAQQQAVLDEIERLRREDDSLETFFSQEREEPFFVKNLETIQGDERDVIALSVGYGKPAADEKLSMNFGPLNQDGGWRRLNVLITRARERCVVFSSIRPEDFRLDASGARGVVALHGFLRYAFGLEEDGDAQGQEAQGTDFEHFVFRSLRKAGLDVERRLGDRDSFYLDLAVRDTEQTGLYRLGIATDGMAYARAQTARDRERGWEDALRRLGWRLHRIWSPDWYRMPSMNEKDLIEIAASPPEQESQPQDAQDDSSRLHKAEARLEQYGFQPYVVFQHERQQQATRFHSQSAGELSRLLAAIVKVEGPIQVDEAIRRAAEGFGIDRVYTKVRSFGRKAVARGLQAGLFAQRGDFLWPKDMTVPPVRRRDDELLREASLICPQELGQAAVTLLQLQFGMSRADLIQQTAQALGFGAAGRAIGAAIELAIETEIERGRIEQEGELLSPPEPQTPVPHLPAKPGVCPRCERKVKEGAKFCPHCGYKLERPTCPECRCSIAPNAKFCPHCGYKLRTQG